MTDRSVEGTVKPRVRGPSYDQGAVGLQPQRRTSHLVLVVANVLQNIHLHDGIKRPRFGRHIVESARNDLRNLAKSVSQYCGEAGIWFTDG